MSQDRGSGPKRGNRPGARDPRRNTRPPQRSASDSSAPDGRRPSAPQRRPTQQRPAAAPTRRLPPNVFRRSGGDPQLAPSTTPCLIKAHCGACTYVNLDYERSLAEKHRKGLAVLAAAGVTQVARIVPPAPSPRPLGYRSLFKLAVRPAAPGASSPYANPDVPQRFAIGLFAPGTHAVVDMDSCPLHVAALRRLIVDLRDELNRSALTPFDEKTGTGQIRYVAARAAHLTGELMLTIVATAPLKSEIRQLALALQRRGHTINSAHVNIHTGSGNAIFGSETIRVLGADGLRERMCDLDFEIGPTSFFQVNPWQAINLYRRVEQLAGPAPHSHAGAWDLYCGTGQMALVLARLGYNTLGIEENEQAVANAWANARRNRLDHKTDFIAARVEDAEDKIPLLLRTPQLIVVNPSRRGLAEATRQHLTTILSRNPDCRFIYVSCEVETLARDVAELTKSGHVVRQVEAFDMFAQTDGMEWLVVMSRQG